MPARSLAVLRLLVAVFFVIVLGLGGWASSAWASPLCREVAGQPVCIESIRRSAKYLWEYRVVISLAGQRQPLKRYDCRPLDPSQAPPVSSGSDSPEPVSAEATPSEAELRQLICGLVTH